MIVEIKIILIVVGIVGFGYLINWLDRNVFNRRK